MINRIINSVVVIGIWVIGMRFFKKEEVRDGYEVISYKDMVTFIEMMGTFPINISLILIQGDKLNILFMLLGFNILMLVCCLFVNNKVIYFNDEVIESHEFLKKKKIFKYEDIIFATKNGHRSIVLFTKDFKVGIYMPYGLLLNKLKEKNIEIKKVGLYRFIGEII